jgi:hypothetical protein
MLQFVYLMSNAPVARFDSDPVAVMRNQASMLILVGAVACGVGLHRMGEQ